MNLKKLFNPFYFLVSEFMKRMIFFAECAEVNADILEVCADSTIPGAEKDFVVINLDDHRAATITKVTDILWSNYVLETGVEGYNYEAPDMSINAGYELILAKGTPRFKHFVEFIIQKNDNVTKAQLERLFFGRVFIFIENKHKKTVNDGDSAFEGYGNSAGLKIAPQVIRNLNDIENAAAHIIRLETPEQDMETHVPVTLFNGTYAYTKTIFDSLMTPAP